jgi:hypothetical protein
MKTRNAGSVARAAGARTAQDLGSLQRLARQLKERARALTVVEEDLAPAISALVAEVMPEEPHVPVDGLRPWQDAARDLVACVLAHFVASPVEVPPEYRLPALRSLLLKPACLIAEELALIAANSPSHYARQLARGLLETETHAALDIIRITAVSRTYWLSAIRDDSIGASP